MKIIGMIILLIGCFILWQHFELKKFRITSYEYQTDKITQSVNFAVVADLHAHVYGRDNDILIQKIKEQKPDMILVPGDMIVSRYPETYETAYQAVKKLTEIAPVYFSNGNHESRVSKVPVMQTEAFLEYENRVRKKSYCMAGSFVSADWKFRWNVMERAVMNHCRSILYRRH